MTTDFFEILDLASEYEIDDNIIGIGDLKELGDKIITNETEEFRGKIAIED